MSKKSPRYFERPDEQEAPLSFWRMLGLVLATHLGVRTKKQRVEDFKRANGQHVFIVGVIYFLLLVSGLGLLVRYIVL